jgi:hypothetical protein
MLNGNGLKKQTFLLVHKKRKRKIVYVGEIDTYTTSIWKTRKKKANKIKMEMKCRLADYSYCLKGCPEMHIWEPKPHSTIQRQSHILAADLSAKRLVAFADNYLRV